MLLARDVLSRNPGGTIIFDVKCSQRLPVVIREAGGVPLMWKTGHSLIKAKLKETGAPIAGEMSGHIFFGERWYGFDDAMYTAARLLEILSRSADPSAVLNALPTSFSTPELNVPCAEGEHHAVVAELQATGQVPRGRGRHHRRPAGRLRRRLRPDPRRQHHAGAGAALRGPHARGAARIEHDFMAALRAVKPDAQVPRPHIDTGAPHGLAARLWQGLVLWAYAWCCGWPRRCTCCACGGAASRSRLPLPLERALGFYPGRPPRRAGVAACRLAGRDPRGLAAGRRAAPCHPDGCACC
jgi:hypothetical protein